MEIKVIRGYVSHEKKLFGAGAILDLANDAAKRLIASGSAEAVASNTRKAEVPVEPVKAKPKQKKHVQEPAAEESGAELPAADPVASVRKRG